MSVVQARLDDVRDAVEDWVRLSSNYEIVDNDQYVPSPHEPYFSLSLVSGLTKIGVKDSIIYHSSENSFLMVGHRRIRATIRARGNPGIINPSAFLRATDMLADLQWSMDKPEVVSAFQKRRLALFSGSEIIDASSVEDTVLIPRAAFDVFVDLAIREVVEVDYIEQINVSGSVDTKQDGQYTYTIGPLEITNP